HFDVAARGLDLRVANDVPQGDVPPRRFGDELPFEVGDLDVSAARAQVRVSLDCGDLQVTSARLDLEIGLRGHLDLEARRVGGPEQAGEPPRGPLFPHGYTDLTRVLLELEVELLLEVVVFGRDEHVGAGPRPAAQLDASHVGIENELASRLELE